MDIWDKAKYNEFNFQPLKGEKMNEIYEKSRCVLDSAQDGQIGLTIRVIEALGAKKKLITTNEDIVNYDFYCPENIYLYNGKFDLDNIFFKSKYKRIDNVIYERYSLRNWLSIAFLLQPLLYTLFTEKRYRKCYSKGKYELKGRWDGFFQNLAFFINNNTDIVLITLLLNLNEVSVYSVYMLVINGMKSVVLSISTGFQSILGRKLAQQNTVKIKEFMKKYFYFILIVSLIGFGTIILLIRQFVCIYIHNFVYNFYIWNFMFNLVCFNATEIR